MFFVRFLFCTYRLFHSHSSDNVGQRQLWLSAYTDAKRSIHHPLIKVLSMELSFAGMNGETSMEALNAELGLF